MKLYKLTDKNGNTKNRTHWDIGVTHEVTGEPKLCTNTVLHAYSSPLLAALMNPAHGFTDPKCFEVEGDIVVNDGMKVGCQKLTVTGTFKLPEVSPLQCAAFGILSALEATTNANWILWARKWLSGEDRSKESATAAYYAATSSTSTDAANAAVYFAYGVTAATAAYNAATATAAANAAADAAESRWYVGTKNINFQELAEKAMEIK